MCHWGSANSCHTTKDRRQQIQLTATGYKLIGPDKKTDFVAPKKMIDVHDCLTNYRSVMLRLWPWDWTSEALIRVLEVIIAV